MIIILGPTATGKSWLSIEIAKKFDGEIISADAYQIYKGMNIGTGKVPEHQREEVRHHGLDVIRPDQYFSAGKFRDLAERAIREICSKRKRPVVVGGTGLYIRALLKGLFEGPARSESIREQLDLVEKGKGTEFLYGILLEKDPGYAKKIAPADGQRIKRALEVFLQSGKKMSDFIEQHGFRKEKYRAVKIGLRLERTESKRRIEERVSEMFASGFVEEVKSLLREGYPPDLHAFNGIGYPWVIGFCRGELSLHEAIERTCRDTRRYAKRQLTWFAKEEGVCWFDAGKPNESLRTEVFEYVGKNLNGLNGRTVQHQDRILH